MIKTILAIAVIGGLLFLGSADAGRDEMIARSCLAVAVVLFYPGMYIWHFFRGAGDAWEEAKSEIDHLKNEMTPVLKVTYDPENINYRSCREIIKNDKGQKIGRIHRVYVENTSKTKTICGVKVVIKRIEGWDHAYTNTPLAPLDFSSEVFDLNPQSGQFVNVFSSLDGRETRFSILYAKRESRQQLPRDPKNICIQAQGQNTPSQTYWVRIGTTPGGKLTVSKVELMEGDPANPPPALPTETPSRPGIARRKRLKIRPG